MNWKNLTNSRLLALACVLFLVLALAACEGGSSGTDGSVREPTDRVCDSVSYPEDGNCKTFAVRIDARAPTPFTENGLPVELEVVLFRPLAEGRYPTIVFHHGSTGNGSDPSRFVETFTHKGLSRYFVEQGWMVAFPQRRGRGKSGGRYDEGFTDNRSSYSCEAGRALSGAERALADADVITDWIRGRPDVDTTRMLVGGVSRGGVLALVHAARRPDIYFAAVNFVGGWIGEGCGDHAVINRTLFEQAAAYPATSTWLYAVNDSFYSIGYSRANFGAFTMAGGVGEFNEFQRAPGQNGHFLINDLALWAGQLQAFIESR